MGARRVILLGSTGSIGTAALEVITHLRSVGVQFDVVGLAAGRNVDVLRAQMTEHGVDHVAIADSAEALDASVVYRGPDAALELVRSIGQPGDLVIAAMVGVAGLKAVLAAIECRCDVALANKETLVAAGAIVMPAAAAAGVQVMPIDSEHSAIWQCLAGDGRLDDVRRIVLTASGGPLRGLSREAVHSASVEQALAHPTWVMGRKITIDSATLVNKALEMIEAHWLFDLDSDRIEALVHPQSVMHGFVEFVDGSVLAQMGPPDMKTPIQVALTWPHRHEGIGDRLDWTALSSLHFEQVDAAVFPSIGMARRVIDDGGTSGAIFNAANEAAVDAFLDGRIALGDIFGCIEEAMEMLPATPIVSIDDVLSADASAREVVARRVDTLQSSHTSQEA